jgi:hypothetical protein
MSRVVRAHADWRTLLEPVEPFLTLPVIKRAFPDGLPPLDVQTRHAVRERYQAFVQAQAGEPNGSAASPRAPSQQRQGASSNGAEGEAPGGGNGAAPPWTQAAAAEAQRQWVRWVLQALLRHDSRLKAGAEIPANLSHVVAEQGTVLRPDFAVLGPKAPGEPDTKAPRLLVRLVPLGTNIVERAGTDAWSASEVERIRTLCRATGCEVGLATDGEQWVLVWAPAGQTGGHGTFLSSLFAPEPELLDAFAALLGARRFFGVAKGDHLEALFVESADAEAEVTNKLGQQVRSAVEILVAALARADRDSKHQLLAGVDPPEVYDASLTVLMRLVFLFAAEERGLLPLGDDFYNDGYAASTLREQLQEDANLIGEEALGYRHSAWHRVLALTRAVHGGISFEDLRMPAYGGGLFDPDRYPFLEGRGKDEPWTEAEAKPLPVDDRTMLEILTRLQVLVFRQSGVTEARVLSYRSLSVEQIGYIYEGLLDHSVRRAGEVMVVLSGKNGVPYEVALRELEGWSYQGREEYVKKVAALTSQTERQVSRKLDAAEDATRLGRLRVAVERDDALVDRIRPHLSLLADDLRELPTVYLPGTLYVTTTSLRRDTGTEYTSRELADEVARYALEPLVYHPGPAEEKDPAKWVLKSASEILSLRVCDPAIGSGAIIVAACRYLADRLVEAWTMEKQAGGEPELNGQPIWTENREELSLLARGAVSDRCLFGVDLNPMAVELAKMSLWLVTMAKERPFTFLDHAFKVGNSLLGVTDVDQVVHFHMDALKGKHLHGQSSVFAPTFLHDLLAPRVRRAARLRSALENTTAFSLRDVERKEASNRRAEQEVADVCLIADVLIGAALSTAGGGERRLEEKLGEVAPRIARAFDPDTPAEESAELKRRLRSDAEMWLNDGRPEGAAARVPFHWPLEYPEVFAGGKKFDAMVGNPPFVGGQKISGAAGTDFRDYIVQHIAGGRRGSADLVAYFFLRATQVSNRFGLLATNTLPQGTTREVGLDAILASAWTIHRAVKSTPWPGTASLEISKVWATKQEWRGRIILDGEPVKNGISSMLAPRRRVEGSPLRLAENRDKSFQGSIVLGMGFVLPPEDAASLIKNDPRNRDVLFPYINGEDLNSRPDQSASRWVINFHDWPMDRAAEYRDCFDIVVEKVKPERAKNRQRDRREVWWRFTRPTIELYRTIAPLARVLAITRVSKVVLPAFIESKQVIGDSIVAFAYDGDGHFGLLTSAFHWWWAVTYASTLETRIRYTPSDIFETFPLPTLNSGVAEVGRALDEHRQELMLRRQIGLTGTYNLVDDPDCTDVDIAQLRELHVALDEAVRGAYAQCDRGFPWEALDLDHGFYETAFGRKWTIGEAARGEILDRLLELNFERHAAEQGAAQNVKKGSKAEKKKDREQTALSF